MLRSLFVSVFRDSCLKWCVALFVFCVMCSCLFCVFHALKACFVVRSLRYSFVFVFCASCLKCFVFVVRVLCYLFLFLLCVSWFKCLLYCSIFALFIRVFFFFLVSVFHG